jgi:hypothetical protein
MLWRYAGYIGVMLRWYPYATRAGVCKKHMHNCRNLHSFISDKFGFTSSYTLVYSHWASAPGAYIIDGMVPFPTSRILHSHFPLSSRNKFSTVQSVLAMTIQLRILIHVSKRSSCSSRTSFYCSRVERFFNKQINYYEDSAEEVRSWLIFFCSSWFDRRSASRANSNCNLASTSSGHFFPVTALTLFISCS